jgi:hypothetical protein
MTFSFTLEQFLFFCGVIVSAGGVFTYFAKVWAKIKQPNAEQNKRLDRCEKRLDEHDALFEKDLKRIGSIEIENHIELQALLALLEHGIDGNNIEQMKQVKNKLQDYLITK